MEIQTIYIPSDGNIFINKHLENEIFNDIGYFITEGKSDKLDTNISYQDNNYTYEVIFSPENKYALNNYASRLVHTEIYGNAVLMASNDKIQSIFNLDIINKIYNILIYNSCIILFNKTA